MAFSKHLSERFMSAMQLCGSVSYLDRRLLISKHNSTSIEGISKFFEVNCNS